MAIKALFFEGIHQDAVATSSRAGYDVRTLPGSPDEPALIREIRDVSVLGVRSEASMWKDKSMTPRGPSGMPSSTPFMNGTMGSSPPFETIPSTIRFRVLC